MARTRNLEVVISGDTRQLDRAFGRAEQSAGKLQGRLGQVGRGMAVAGTAAAGALALGLTKATQAAIEAEKSQARMQTQLKASGINYRNHAKEIDNVIQRTAKLAAVDDEDLQDAFTNIVRSTGNVQKSLRLTGLAADLAAAKHIDVAKAGEIVGKVAAGNTGVLSRYGITIDKGASSTEALGQLQQRFAGQAEAYGKTTAGSMDRARNSLENLGEVVGAKTAPLIAKAADAFSGLITGSSRAGQAVRTFAGRVRAGFDAAREAVSGFARRNRRDLDGVIDAVQAVGRFFKRVFEGVILPTVRAVLPGIRQAISGIITTVRGLVRIVSGLLTGDWKRVWDGVKDVVAGAFRAMRGLIRAQISFTATLLRRVGEAAARGLVSGLGNLGHLILDKIKDAAGWVKGKVGGLFKGIGGALGIGEGIGKAVGDGLGPGGLGGRPPGGAALGSLMGAQSALAPFAAVGARFGLQVSSGRRPGSITSSGNTSYHSTGEAVDLAGPPGGMLQTFRYLKSNFGSRLAELIHTPGGSGIKNGRPFTYGGQVARDHFDHVHVAFDTGRPGVGDGLGRAAAAARAAGFKGQALITALAIAGAESGYNPRAQNLKYPDHSIGLWQINQLAHKGRFGSDSALMNPLANAKAAFALSGGGRNWGPWTTYTSGAYRSYLARARAAAVGSRGGAGTRGTTGTVPTSPGGGGTRDTTSPYELAIAGSDVEIAEASGGRVVRGAGGRVVSSPALAETAAQRRRLGIVNRRITSVRARLKTAKTRAGKLRLRQELASLLGERSTIKGRLTELSTLPETEGGTTAAGGTEVGGEGGGAEGDPNQALIDAINAKAEQDRQLAEEQRRATEEHTAALNALKDEQKRAVDLAATASTSGSYQAWKALADIMSGQLGQRVVSRGFTASTGVSVAY